ncbi:MAG: metal-dependent hydrolase [Solirubrobacteraceae bacterium]|jgi:membrane-bound metal-dependent hydrolase YbcI (DUF457 family)
MMGRSHVLIAGAGYLALAATARDALGPPAPAQLAAGALCAGAASLLPDLDRPGSTIARALGPVSDLLARLVSLIAGGHRRGTHSLLAWLAVSVGLGAALHSSDSSTVALIVCVLACALMLRAITGAGAMACAVLAFGVGVALVAGVGHVDRWLPGAVLVGYGSHLVGDLVTVEGVPLLWPLSGRHQKVALIGATDRWREHLVCMGAGALCAYLAVTLIAAPALAAAGSR